jgi:hypothetical protein
MPSRLRLLINSIRRLAVRRPSVTTKETQMRLRPRGAEGGQYRHRSNYSPSVNARYFILLSKIKTFSGWFVTM